MRLRTVAEVAAWLAWTDMSGKSLNSSRFNVAITEFIKHSKFLFRRWENQLLSTKRNFSSNSEIPLQLEEIFVSELLSRLFVAKVFNRDERAPQTEYMETVLATLSDHISIGNRVLNELRASQYACSSLLRCERLQRKIHRWSDYLISFQLTKSDEPLAATYDAERCLMIADERLDEPETDGLPVTRQLELAALTRSMPNRVVSDLANGEAHRVRCQNAFLISGENNVKNSDFTNASLRRKIIVGETFSLNDSPNFEAEQN